MLDADVVADNARATLLLVPQEGKGQYVLRGAKRRDRLEWKDSTGAKVFKKHIEWAEGHIGWREVDEATVLSREAAKGIVEAGESHAMKRKHVEWAIREAGGVNGRWVEREDAIAISAQRPGGPMPKGLKERAFRDMVKVMGSSIEEKTGKNKNNRTAIFIRLRVFTVADL